MITRRDLYIEHSFELIEKNQVQVMLGDQDLLLFKAMNKKQALDYMPENSFMLLMKNQISVFNDEQREVNRITGLSISGAFVIESPFNSGRTLSCGACIVAVASSFVL